jgi:hypothetical protein
MIRRVRDGFYWLLIVVILIGCGGQAAPGDVLPGESAIPGWTPVGEAQTFDTENLYDLVNGQAEAFFAYNYEQVAVQTYESASGENLRVEVWQVATPADAYGLFSAYRAGQPVSVGNEGDTDPGRRLDFWQDRAFVRLFAVSPVDDDILESFAEEIAEALPSGGERPALVNRLPQDGLIVGSDVFFHQEISIQDYVWLGGQNLLSMGSETDAVLARYAMGGEEMLLLLVEYPDAASAFAALEDLQGGGIGSLTGADVQDNLLGAVFGGMVGSDAQALLLAALGK